jgi:hypothetical protein
MRNGRVHVAGTGIPGSGRYFGYRGMDPNCDGFGAVVHRLPSARFPNAYSPIFLSILLFRFGAKIRACKDRLCAAAVQPAAKAPHWPNNSGAPIES